MNIDYQKTLDLANIYYAEQKTKHISPDTLKYWAPEMFPKIESDQVKSILRALIEQINSAPQS